MSVGSLQGAEAAARYPSWWGGVALLPESRRPDELAGQKCAREGQVSRNPAEREYDEDEMTTVRIKISTTCREES